MVLMILKMGYILCGEGDYMFYIHLKKQGNCLYVRLDGKLVKTETFQIEDFLIPYIKKNQIKNLFFDCKNLKKLDLDGKYALLNTKIKMKEQKGSFLLCNMTKAMKEGLVGFHFKIRSEA